MRPEAWPREAEEGFRTRRGVRSAGHWAHFAVDLAISIRSIRRGCYWNGTNNCASDSRGLINRIERDKVIWSDWVLFVDLERGNSFFNRAQSLFQWFSDYFPSRSHIYCKQQINKNYFTETIAFFEQICYNYKDNIHVLRNYTEKFHLLTGVHGSILFWTKYIHKAWRNIGAYNDHLHL